MKIRDILRGQQQSYIAFAQWFAKRAGVKNDQLAPGALLAIEDMARFCRYGQTCFDKDARIHAVLEGRREVFQRLLDHMCLTPDQIAVVRGLRLNREIDSDG